MFLCGAHHHHHHHHRHHYHHHQPSRRQQRRVATAARASTAATPLVKQCQPNLDRPYISYLCTAVPRCLLIPSIYCRPSPAPRQDGHHHLPATRLENAALWRESRAGSGAKPLVPWYSKGTSRFAPLPSRLGGDGDISTISDQRQHGKKRLEHNGQTCQRDSQSQT